MKLGAVWRACLLSALFVAGMDLAGLWAHVQPGQRWTLGWRLVGFAFAWAGIAAALLFALGRAALASSRRARTTRVWTAPFLLAALPFASYVAWALFQGGQMRRVSAAPLLIGVTAIALVGSVDVACRGARWMRRTLGRRTLGRRTLGRRTLGRRTKRASSALMLSACVLVMSAVGALGVVNHSYMPGHYEYLHVSLVLVSFCTAYAVFAALPPKRVPSVRATGAITAGALALSLVGLVTGGRTVRAALYDTRAPAARALISAVGPLVDATAMDPDLDPAFRARVRSEGPDLPLWQGANVLFVTIDALRADHLGAYGYSRGVSPTIDALAERGVLFERAYAQAPHSSYSICSLMVSEYLHETVDLGRPLPTNTLPQELGAAGYRTMGLYPNGIFHTEGESLAAYRDSEFGLDVHDARYLDAESVTDAALKMLEEERSSGGPNFLWVHYFDVHHPYRETSLGTGMIDRYDGEIGNVDRALDRLVRRVRRRLGENLVIVLTADHGEELRDHGGLFHGNTLYEEQIHVPLLIVAPGLDAQRVTRPVELVDLAPTLLLSLGHAPAASMRGDDLRALLVGRSLDLPPAASGVADRRAAIDERFKLVTDLGRGLFELYDLERDPREQRNLADDRPEELRHLHGVVLSWLESLREPSSDPRVAALDMARLGDVRAIPQLVELLEDVDADPGLRARAAAPLAALGEQTEWQVLRVALDADAREVSVAAALALGSIAEPAAAPLLRELLDEDEHRLAAAFGLAELGDSSAVPVLASVVEADGDRRVRERAAYLLGQSDDPRAFDPLCAALEVPHLRQHAAEALGYLGDERGVAALLPQLAPGVPIGLQVGAIRGLGRLGDGAALDALVRLVVTTPEVSRDAAEAIVRCGALDTAVASVGGVDFDEDLGAPLRCQRDPEAPFSGVTTCVLETSELELGVRRVSPSPAGYLGLFRARSTGEPFDIVVNLGAGTDRTLELGSSWTEARWQLTAREATTSSVRFRVPEGEGVELDHLLLVAIPR